MCSNDSFSILKREKKIRINWEKKNKRLSMNEIKESKIMIKNELKEIIEKTNVLTLF